METRYYWECESDDGYYEVSEKKYKTRRECYNAMRKRALEKMEWNTNYNEDFDMSEKELDALPIDNEFDGENSISYDVRFYPNKIVHTSYSGTYTYKMKEVLPCPEYKDWSIYFVESFSSCYDIMTEINKEKVSLGRIYLNGYIDLYQHNGRITSPNNMKKIVDFAQSLASKHLYD